MAPLVVHVTGARPNFPKAAPVLEALGTYDVEQLLVHTGQHYDEALSQVFFDELELPLMVVQLSQRDVAPAVQRHHHQRSRAPDDAVRR